MMNEKKNDSLDIREKGRSRNGEIIYMDRRLFMQFLAFGSVKEIETFTGSFKSSGFAGVIYKDLNDPWGIGLLVFSEDPDFFVSDLRDFLVKSPFSSLAMKNEYTMFGRTYSIGYENELERTLISGPAEKVLDQSWPWAIWYPLRRVKSFETLSQDEQRSILGEHGKVGFQFGNAGYARDIRLASFGLDKNDNDFVIGVLGKNLHPVSAVIQHMRKTKQTSKYLESLGPFFVGKAVVQQG